PWASLPSPFPLGDGLVDSCSRKGVSSMEYVTWSDLIQYSILIVAIIALMHDIFHNNDNKRK
ncbi:hypothetical protein, partial [Ruminococcus callidus]|uniref:hypothetical protein n=1 Tax=Ruminococcus callidus TaxID=40519 RepID=UPI00399F20BE